MHAVLESSASSVWRDLPPLSGLARQSVLGTGTERGVPPYRRWLPSAYAGAHSERSGCSYGGTAL